jgi:hypothetical protein
MALTIKHVEQADARIQKRFGKGVRRAEAKFHFVPRDRVQDEYLKLHPKASAPDGFVDPSSTPYQVWIPHDHKDETLVTHETMHLYGMWYRQIFPVRFGVNINEGVTEYFTRQVVSERRDSYTAEYAEIAYIVKTMGTEEPLRQAYFHGCFVTWQGAVGLLTFVKWAEQMRSAQWQAARKILQNPPDKPKNQACKTAAAP